VHISNRGQEIASTDYWQTEHARRGYLYLSFNAGALRVLVPEPAVGSLQDLPPAGTPCEYLQEGLPGEPRMPALLWNDDPAQPYRIAVSSYQVDRRVREAEDDEFLVLSGHGHTWYGMRVAPKEGLPCSSAIPVWPLPRLCSRQFGQC